MHDPLGFMPDWWKVDVTVESGGGRDSRGNPKPVDTRLWEQVLIAGRETFDPMDASDVSDDRAVLYGDHFADGFRPSPTAAIVVPKGQRFEGRWTVSGMPVDWPYGWEIRLERK